ncbi:MMS19 nucleotide excision repair protein homolog [Macrobrachium rosenbergii]|uniref:MMS19 nucleotide excision repair protein homolog n=1 Tax=Macrobrachium rosenbergii TaxID=79674 RepID=UPI0034D468BE
MISSKADILRELDKLPNSSLQDVNALLHSLVPKIEAKEISLLEVIEALGTSLTNPNPSHRGIGTRLLADVLHTLPRNKLNHEEIIFLTAFFVDRFKDHHSVTPHVIYAIMGLAEQENIGKDEIVALLKALFREVHCQSQIMTDRRNIFTFLKFCILNKIEAVQEMGTDFVLGFVTAMDGEKDPRNLVLLFAVVPVIVKCLPLGPFTEELFEVVAAYFPIDFVPPADDPFGISAEDLVLGLRQALSSTPAFAPFCIPLIQEKLDSDLYSAKLDALHTLVACCDIYTSEDIRPHVSPLWVSIRREVVERSSDEAESAALLALTSMMKALERGAVSQASRDAGLSLTNSALMECLGHLTAPEQRLMYPSAHLLIALIASGPGPTTSIAEKVLPLLAQQFVSKTEESARKNTIVILGRFMEETSKYSEMTEESGVLPKYEDVCWEAFSQGLSCSSSAVQEATVTAVRSAMSVLSSEHLTQAANTMTSLLISVNNKHLRDSIINTFSAMSQVQPRIVSDHIFPHLLREMEQGNLRNCGVTDSQILDTLAILTSGKLLLVKVLPVLWKRAEETMVSSPECSCLHFSCIQKILKNTLQDDDCQKYVVEEWKGIFNIVGMSVRAIVSEEIKSPVPILKCLSAIARVLVTHMKDTKPLVESMIQLLLHNGEEELSDLSRELLSAHQDISDLLAQFMTSTRAMLLVYLYEGVMLGMPRSFEASGLDSFLEKLREQSMNSCSPEVQETAAVLLASILNKIPMGSNFNRIISTSSEKLTEALETTNPTDKREAALQTLTWICKALVVRGAQEEKVWTEKMLSLLCDPAIGQKAAQDFEIILKEHEYAFRPETFSNIRLLYKQRYFENVVGPLVDTFDNTAGNTKENALLAVSSILPHLPTLVLNAHIKKLLPVLLQGVTSDKLAVKETTLSTLATLLKQTAVHATPHISTLIPNLLSITSNQPMGIRMKALECLEALASLPVPVLRPYKEKVISELRPVLNDKKRVVRQSAVSARSSWLLVGAPGKS